MPIIDAILSVAPDQGQAMAFKGSIRAYFAIKQSSPNATITETRKAILGHSEAIEQHFGFSVDEMDEYMQEFFAQGVVEDSPLKNAIAIVEADGVHEFPDSLMMSPRMCRLATLCRVLSNQSPDGVFYMSTRTVSDTLGISNSGGAMLLRKLCEKGIIEKLNVHKRGSMKAQRFKCTEYTEY